MDSIFSGLDAFGLDKQDDLFAEHPSLKPKIDKAELDTRTLKKLVYSTKTPCPVCNSQVKVQAIKKNGARFSHVNTILRPVYKGVDPLCYEIQHCTACGYAATTSKFKLISSNQKKMVRERISSKYIARNFGEVYSYEVALLRLQLALYNDLTIGRNAVDLAFQCLKGTWILEAILEQDLDSKRERYYKGLLKTYTYNAYKGFKQEYPRIVFPVLGMNRATYEYLLAALARMKDDKEGVDFWLSKILLSKTSGDMIKEKARQLKNEL